mgnify:CR=1 FL=1
MEHWLGISVPAQAWRSALSGAVATILTRPPAGVGNFPRTLAIAAAYGERLASEAAVGVSVDVHGYVERYPLAATLLLQATAPAASTALVPTLTWLLLELRAAQERPDVVERLARIIRGMLGRRDHRLLGVIGECNGLAHLTQKLDYLKADSLSADAPTGHADFDSLWSTRLAAACHELLRAPAEAIDEQVASTPLDEPSLNPLSESKETHEDDHEYLHSIEAIAPWDPPVPRYVASLQSAGHALVRRGAPGLMRHPSGIAPRGLMAREWGEALRML